MRGESRIMFLLPVSSRSDFVILSKRHLLLFPALLHQSRKSGFCFMMVSVCFQHLPTALCLCLYSFKPLGLRVSQENAYEEFSTGWSESTVIHWASACLYSFCWGHFYYSAVIRLPYEIISGKLFTMPQSTHVIWLCANLLWLWTGRLPA